MLTLSISCHRHGAQAERSPDFPTATLIRLYELLKNDSRSCERTQQQAELPALEYALIFGGGGERDRTDDPLLAKQVLSQLSYTPI